MKTKQDKLKFLEEMVEHYKHNPRGMTGSNCTYSGGCAIGRLIPDKYLCGNLDNCHSNTEVSNSDIFNQLPDDLKNYGIAFLTSIQRLHDTQSYWETTEENLNELTLYGIEFFNKIKTVIKEETM